MSRDVRLDTLRSRVRWRCDIENETTRFPNSELLDGINEGIAKFHSRVVRARAQNLYEDSTTVTTSAQVEVYALPAEFMEVVKASVNINGFEVDLLPYEFLDTDGYSDTASWQSMMARPQYRLRGANISFRPIPDAAYTVTVVYIPTAVKLVADSDTMDGVDGLEEFVVAWASKRVAIKQKDTELIAILDREMETALQEIDGLVHARSAGAPPVMQDVRRLRHPYRWRRRWAP